MPKKVILRTDLNKDLIPDHVRDAISIEAGKRWNEIEIQPIYGRRGYKDAYVNRITSIHDGFDLLIDSLPDDKNLKIQNLKLGDETSPERAKLYFKNYMQQLKADYIAEIAKTDPYDIVAQQQIFTDYSKRLTFLTSHYLGLSEKDAAKRLSRAEEYAVIKNGQPDVYTLSTNSYVINGEKESEYVIQGDRALDPLSDKLKQEYLNVLSKDESKQPRWYRVLPDFEKDLLQKTLSEAKSPADIRQTMGAISSKHRTVPGVANYRSHILLRAQHEGKERPQVKKLRDVTRSSMIASRDIQKGPQELRDQHTGHNLEKVIRDHYDPYARNYLANAKKTGAGLTIVNGVVVISMPPALIQTLITPLFMKQPDSGLYKDKNRAVQRYINELKNQPIELEVNGEKIKVKYDIPVINTNHPLNPGRFIIPAIGPIKIFGITLYKGSPSTREGLKLAELALKEGRLTNNSALTEAGKDLKDLLGRSAIRSFFSNNIRELFLSSLEQFITAEMHGLPYGSCVSGKDRKGLEVIHSDAMALYYDRYGKLPKFDDKGEDRKNFVKIVADIYISRHQQDVAGLNAPGSQGVKTPYNYYPKDIQNAIKERIEAKARRAKNRAVENGKVIPLPNSNRVLKDDDRLASNNEIVKVVKKAAPYTAEEEAKYLKEADTALEGMMEKYNNKVITDPENWISTQLHRAEHKAHGDEHHETPGELARHIHETKEEHRQLRHEEQQRQQELEAAEKAEKTEKVKSKEPSTPDTSPKLEGKGKEKISDDESGEEGVKPSVND